MTEESRGQPSNGEPRGPVGEGPTAEGAAQGTDMALRRVEGPRHDDDPATGEAIEEPLDVDESDHFTAEGRTGRHSPYAYPYPPPSGSYPPPRPEPPAWIRAVRPDEPPAPIRAATVWAALATGLLAALLFGEGLGVNLLLVSVPAVIGAYVAAASAGRRPRTWTLLWAAGCLVLLAVPALRDAAWPSTLAVLAALGVGSLALQGGRTWFGALAGPFGIPAGAVPGLSWAWRGVRERAQGSRERWRTIVRTSVVAAVLVLVFGALFAGADAAFADLIGGLLPEASLAHGPSRFFFFLVALVGALAAARVAAAPWRWDRIRTAPGRARGRLEWAFPLIALNVVFAVFIGVQLTVLFGGYDRVLRETGLTYSEYARQGFWQLLWATLLTLVVIGLALRWAPRGRQRDHALVRGVLGALCVLTLVVVLSALRRMDLYVEAYGLTRLRVSVTAMELWLGLVIVLIIIAGASGAVERRKSSWLPRAVTGTATAGVLAFGLLSPDALVAEQNVERYQRTGKIDVFYLQNLSADAVPALDELPEPLRSCALRYIADELAMEEDEPWYATSYGEARAREILRGHPVRSDVTPCGYVSPYRDGYPTGG